MPSIRERRPRAAAPLLVALRVVALLLSAEAVRAAPLPVLELVGIKATAAAPSRAVADLELAVGDSVMPFTVTDVRRLAPRPGTGPRLLQGLGPGVARLRVVGAPAAARVLERAPNGTSLRIRGRLDLRSRLLHLLAASVEPAATP